MNELMKNAWTENAYAPKKKRSEKEGNERMIQQLNERKREEVEIGKCFFPPFFFTQPSASPSAQAPH